MSVFECVNEYVNGYVNECVYECVSVQMTLVNNCRPASRPFRASSSNFFFLAVLLIGLALATLPVTVSIAQ